MTITLRQLAATLTLAIAFAGCGGDDDDGPAVDSGTSVDASTTVDAGAGACPYTGSYTLESYACDATDITAAWKTAIPTTTVTFTSMGTGCRLAITYTSPMCMEGEAATVTNLGPTASFMWTGITSCAPAACKFSTNDAACSMGDRVSARTGSLTTEGAKVRLRYNFMDNVCNGVQANIVLSK